ncbi:MAG: mycofactocin precursor MftA [Galbitalea sp.]
MSPTEQATTISADSGESIIESDTLVEEISIDGMCGVY